MTIEIYRENIIDHYQNPRHYGKPENITVHFEGANLSCGDELDYYLLILDNKIKDIGFTANACAICTASASMLAEQLYGKNTSAITNLKPENIKENLGIDLSPVRLKCALLPLETLKNLEKESASPEA